MKLKDWKAQSVKRLEKSRQAPAGKPTKFTSYLANLKTTLANLNYEYGTVKCLADTNPMSPVYNPYGRSIGRWCVFGADGWELWND